MLKDYVLIVCFMYLFLLFGIAYFAEQRRKRGKSIVNNPYIYALSLAVYCTAWTFFGSVGRAASSGMDFLTVYIGPTLLMPFWQLLHKRIIRISKAQNLTTIADFISARYGKSPSLGGIVTGLALLGIIPYIAIQLKAISTSFELITATQQSTFRADVGFYTALILGIFIITFGTRYIDSTARNEGMVASITFESLIKIAAFLAIGFFVTYSIFEGFSDVFSFSLQKKELTKIISIGENNYFSWFMHSILCMLAFMFLPRQFHLSVTENIDEKHTQTAIWLFPLYLLIINIFVIPIALGGKLITPNLSADNYVLSIPVLLNEKWLTIIVFIGGFSAATGMIIVETMTLSVMVSNYIILPFLLKFELLQVYVNAKLSTLIKNIRRICVVFILFAAVYYFKNVADNFTLVSIGLISFVAVAQFAPAMLGGLFWKKATKTGAISGLVVGGGIWFYTLIIPSFIESGLIGKSLITNGLFSPKAFLGLSGLDEISHGFFWSILANTFTLILVSLFSTQTSIEQSQAEFFVDILKFSEQRSASLWKGRANFKEIIELLSSFFGEERAQKILSLFATKNQLNVKTNYADPKIVQYAESLLASIVGASSARLLIASTTTEEEISRDELIKILKKSKKLERSNIELTQKSEELARASLELQKANDLLQQSDKVKNDFLSSVTHEIRTPLTSIRALSELLYENPDIDSTHKNQFLGTVIQETDRLTRLVNQVLDLERYDSGKQQLLLKRQSILEVAHASFMVVRLLAEEKNIEIILGQNDYEFRFDRDKMEQVFINLLTNSIKFCRENGKIRLQFHPKGKYFYFHVFDNGVGIEEKYRELVFEKFYQAENQSLIKPQGSGLGLSIVRKIVELHGGKIRVANSSKEGTEIVFYINKHL